MATITYPFSDENMEYDYDNHRYVLTEKCVLDELNIDLLTRLNTRGHAVQQVQPKKFLKRVSDIVYTQIYKYNINNDVQEYVLAKAPSARAIIKEAMLNQVEFLLLNGDVSRYAGIDVKNAKVIPIAQLRNQSVLDETCLEVLQRPIKEWGRSILYAGNITSFNGKIGDYSGENY